MKDELSALKHIDRIIHEPARLIIVVILSAVDEADFLYLLRATDLTKGNLSSHLSRLEAAGYVRVNKSFVGKVPRTVCSLTEEGSAALEIYRKQLKAII